MDAIDLRRRDLLVLLDDEVLVDVAFELFLALLVVEHQVKSVIVLVLRIDAVCCEASAQAVGPVVHELDRLDDPAPSMRLPFRFKMPEMAHPDGMCSRSRCALHALPPPLNSVGRQLMFDSYGFQLVSGIDYIKVDSRQLYVPYEYLNFANWWHTPFSGSARQAKTNGQPSFLFAVECIYFVIGRENRHRENAGRSKGP